MIVTQEEKLMAEIQRLSELEFSSLLKQMAEHLRRNNWEYIIDSCFDIESFENELEEMKEERDDWRDRARKAEGIISEIKDLI